MAQLRKRFENPLHQYWRILVKRRKTVAIVALGTIALTYVHTESLPPRYRARSKILIEDTTKWFGINDKARLSIDWYSTQFQILQSIPVVKKVIERLDLTRKYTMSPSRLDILRAKLLGEQWAQETPDAGRLVPLIQNSMSIQPQGASGMFQVSIDASDPELARDIANAVVQIYIEENINQRLQLSSQMTDYLERRLRKISARIQEKERKLEDFEQAEGVTVTDGALSVGADQLREFTTAYLDAQQQKWEKSESLRVLTDVVKSRKYSGLSGAAFAGSAVEQRSKDLFDAQIELDKLLDQGLKDKHPQVIAMRDKISTIRKRLQFESKAHIDGLRSEIAALEQRERSLYDMIQQLRPGAVMERKKRAQWEFLQREIAIQKGFYDTYNEKLKRLQLIDDVRPVSIRVVEQAEAPASPYSPNTSRNMLLGALAGLLLGLFLAFLRDYLDDTIKTSDDIRNYLGMPTLGSVPVINDSMDRGKLMPWRVDTSSMVIESYRGLRTNLQFFETERPLRTILVSSGAPREGKSTTAANIALTLVQTGKRVCLVDTDLRRPTLHRLFHKPNEGGVTSLLAKLDDRQSFLVPTGHSNLLLLPCGPLPPNPAELLASRRMERVIEDLRKDYDYVIFDSPPVLLVTDALVLSSMVDGVLLVLRSDETRIAAAQETVDALASIKANVIGAVLNRVNYKRSQYYAYDSKYLARYGFSSPSRQANTADRGKRRRRKRAEPAGTATERRD